MKVNYETRKGNHNTPLSLRDVQATEDIFIFKNMQARVTKEIVLLRRTTAVRHQRFHKLPGKRDR